MPEGNGVVRMKIAVTGAGGFLGSRVTEYYKKQQGCEVTGLTRSDLDFTVPEAVDAWFAVHRPDVFIHAGAISDTGVCERNPELSYIVNVKGTEYIAAACHKYGTKLISCSSDQVYAGSREQRAHRETEELAPSNVYGRHKLQAEQICMRECPDSVSLRLSWMYDIPTPERGTKPNMLTGIMDAVKNRTVIRRAVHDFRGITDVDTVVRMLIKCVDFPGGVYNWGSENTANTYELAGYTAELLGGRALVEADTEMNAGCPRNLTMDMEKARRLGAQFPDTMEGIKKCLERYHMIR